MIYCGSGSVPNPDLFGKILNNKKCVQNLAFLMLEAALFPRNLANFFTFVLHLCWIRVQIRFRNRNALQFRVR
jgi:hypothetical protein